MNEVDCNLQSVRPREWLAVEPQSSNKKPQYIVWWVSDATRLVFCTKKVADQLQTVRTLQAKPMGQHSGTPADRSLLTQQTVAHRCPFPNPTLNIIYNLFEVPGILVHRNISQRKVQATKIFVLFDNLSTWFKCSLFTEQFAGLLSPTFNTCSTQVGTRKSLPQNQVTMLNLFYLQI